MTSVCHTLTHTIGIGMWVCCVQICGYVVCTYVHGYVVCVPYSIKDHDHYTVSVRCGQVCPI